MAQVPLTRREIGDGIAPVNGAALRDGATRVKERLGKLGFARIARPNQAHVTNVFGTIAHRPSPLDNRYEK
jgi:hypothetical protein